MIWIRYVRRWSISQSLENINFLQNQLADVKRKFQRDLSPLVISNELANTKVYFEKMQQNNVFKSTDKSPLLFQAFLNIAASKLQQHNLLYFRDIVRDSLNLQIQSNILKDSSVEKSRIRKHNLQTFMNKKVNNRQIN